MRHFQFFDIPILLVPVPARSDHYPSLGYTAWQPPNSLSRITIRSRDFESLTSVAKVGYEIWRRIPKHCHFYILRWQKLNTSILNILAANPLQMYSFIHNNMYGLQINVLGISFMPFPNFYSSWYFMFLAHWVWTTFCHLGGVVLFSSFVCILLFLKKDKTWCYGKKQKSHQCDFQTIPFQAYRVERKLTGYHLSVKTHSFFTQVAANFVVLKSQ